jgi:recombination protein RecA
MPTSSAVRLQIETALASKIPSALTPAPKMIRPVSPTGITVLDELLLGGLPVGAISELVGPECSGRTSVALSFLAKTTQKGKACAWIDVSDTLEPSSAAATGIDLTRLLWVRCGVLPNAVDPHSQSFVLPAKYLVSMNAKKGFHGGGVGQHPRMEARGLSKAIDTLLRPNAIDSDYTELQRHVRSPALSPLQSPGNATSALRSRKPLSRMEQALRTTDLLLQEGGFSAIVVDMGSISPEAVSRVPLATWFRYRAAAERTQSSILLLTQHACANSSAEVVLQFQTADAICIERTIFQGISPSVEVFQRRFPERSKNILSVRKPARRAEVASWHSRTVWAGVR